MARHFAVCQDTTFWDACDWTTYDGTVITNATERDASYEARYTSLFDYEAAQAKSLSEPEYCEILGPWTTPDTEVSINGFGTSIYVFPTIATVGVARFPNTNHYKIQSSVATVIAVNDSNILFDGLFIKSLDPAYDCVYESSYQDGNKYINCIATGGRRGFNGNAYNLGGYYKNCIAYNNAGSGFKTCGKDYNPVFVSNCVAYNNGGDGFERQYLAPNSTFHNCIAIGNAGEDFEEGYSSSRPRFNCISSDATAATNGTDCYTGVTAAEVFNDAPNGDFSIPSTSFAFEKGIKITEGPYDTNPLIGTTPIYDIIGLLRSDPPDIGAYEYDDGYVPGVPLKVSGMVEGSVLAIYKASDGSEIVAPTTIDATGEYTGETGHSSDFSVAIKVRKSSSGTKYKPWTGLGTITSTGLNVVVSQVEDTVAV